MDMGFRKSLFGFNSADVMEYIERNHYEFAAKEKNFNLKITELEESLAQATAQINNMLNEKEVLESKLKDYDSKYEEMERLSQSIGKLYLVAEANADSVINNAKENVQNSELEIKNNISLVESAHNALSDLNTEILKTASEFSEKLKSLMISLNKTKDSLSSGTAFNNERFDEYEALIAELHAENR